jgi:hypothetical protein
VGTTLRFGVDNPLGTQNPGSMTFVALAYVTDPNYPCGTLVANTGMSAPGTPGEVLVSLANPAPFKTLTGPAWAGPGIPAGLNFVIPNQQSLLGRAIYAQGRLVDSTPGAPIPTAMTSGFQMVLGP